MIEGPRRLTSSISMYATSIFMPMSRLAKYFSKIHTVDPRSAHVPVILDFVSLLALVAKPHQFIHPLSLLLPFEAHDTNSISRHPVMGFLSLYSVLNSSLVMIGAARAAGIRSRNAKHGAEHKKISRSKSPRHSIAAVTTNTSDSTGKLLSVPSPVVPRKRSGSVPSIRLNLATVWNLKPDNARALKHTWARLCEPPRSNCKGIVAIMDRVFEKMETKEKSLRDIFYRSAFVDSMVDRGCKRQSASSIATLRDHTHFFVSLISRVIHSLDQHPQDTFEHIDKIGQFHADLRRLGFRASMWDTLGEILIDALVVQDCVRGFPEACRSWTLLIAALTDRLRAAKSSAPHRPMTPEDTEIARLTARRASSPKLTPIQNIFALRSISPMSLA
uniref:GLOBIN domain-containing protein n=1 Tax=Steinernema glaseri TaxID=37863 RepID=A0A1I7YCX2_9BILA